MKRSQKYILNIAECITSENNLKTKRVDISLKNKCIAYCFELPFGIISISSYVDIETMNVISSDAELNKTLANSPNSLFYCCLTNWHKKYVKIYKII